MISGPEQIVRTTVDVAGTTLSVLVTRPDPAHADAAAAAGLPPVLALHGFGSSAHHTFGVTGHLRELSRAGRTVIAPDLPGHGSSAKPHEAERYRREVLLEVVEALPDRVREGVSSLPTSGVAGWDLLGYSLGARLSAELLDRGHWRRAVLGGYDGRRLFDGVDVPALRVALAAGLWEPSESPAGGSVPLTGESVLTGQTQRIASIAAAVPGNDAGALIALVEGLDGLPAAPVLADRPVLLVAGDRDPLAAGAAALAAASPRAVLMSVPGRDHISTVPAKPFRSAAADFLGRTD